MQGPSRGTTLPDSFGCLWHIVVGHKAWQLRLLYKLRDQVGVGCAEQRGTPGTLHGIWPEKPRLKVAKDNGERFGRFKLLGTGLSNRCTPMGA